MRKQLLKRINRVICAEMKELLKESTITVSGASPEVFTRHTWHSHYATLQRIAPFLVGILDACIPKSSSRRQCTIAICIAVLVKSHRRSTLFHLLVSLVLSSGHAAKQVCISSYSTIKGYNPILSKVYSRLQNLGICLSNTSTVKLLDIIGHDHDHIVKKWVEELRKLMPTSHVSRAIMLGTC